MIIASEEEMENFAIQLAEKASGGDIFLLIGDLGSGKTTFTKAFAKALGVKDTVTSPTFTIAAEYDVPEREDISQLIHLDLYRLEKITGSDRAYIKNLLETAQEKKRIIVIEWAEKLGVLTPLHAKTLHFQHGETPTQRLISIQ